jgi:hypothetical protein
MCPSCGDPLVCTFVWPGKEFVCMGCGALWEWLQPIGAAETPDLLAKCDERLAEWKEISDGLAPHRSFFEGCETCYPEPHRMHATEAELVAHEAAAKRIGERLGRTVE